MSSPSTQHAHAPMSGETKRPMPPPKSSSFVQRPVPSSASEGTFLETPVLENQYHSDTSLRRSLGLFLPQNIIRDTAADLSRFGDEVLTKKVFDWVSDAERNLPFVRGSGRDAFGHRTDELVTTEGWRNLQKLGLKEGIVAIAYENDYAEYSRVVQFIKYHLWSGSNANVSCPSAMQDGAASLLSRHLSTPTSNLTAEARGVLQKAFKNLTARDESAWTSGQWMTERVGGSDISGTETLARYHPLEASEKYKQTQIDGSPLGPWVLDGFKWFSSATDSQMTVALAQTPRGLSTFYIPMRRTSSLQLGGSELNGISISRLKNKLGTKPVPTAELELKGARAFLIGEEGNGVREISTILNITRVHNSAIAMGYLGRGIAIAKAFAEVREMVGKGKRVVLKDMKLHAKTLADLVVRYRANLLFTYFTVYCLGVSDQDPSKQTSKPSVAAERLRPRNGNDLQLLLRVLTSTLKALTAKTSIAGLQECMEALGGVGYLENEESQHINVARLFRDSNVLAIWEGTTNVLATDFIKTIKGRNGEQTLRALAAWAAQALSGPSSALGDEKSGLDRYLRNWESDIKKHSVDELMPRARELMERFGAIIMGILLIVDAERDGDEVSGEILRRYAETRGLVSVRSGMSFVEQSAWDYRIVFGEEGGNVSTPRL